MLTYTSLILQKPVSSIETRRKTMKRKNELTRKKLKKPRRTRKIKKHQKARKLSFLCKVKDILSIC